MSKIVKIDSQQLSDYKWKKCVLGVIHPEHTAVKKIDELDTFSDLVITAKPAQLNFKSSYVPPPSVPIKRPDHPRRPKSAKPGTDVVAEAFNSIPKARQDRKNFMRTSLIAGKDLKNSISDYKSRLAKAKTLIQTTKPAKYEYNQQIRAVDKLLVDKFKVAALPESEYSELQSELLKLSQDYDSQISKQKITLNFLMLKEAELDLQELNRMFAEFQLKKEKQLILLQHFVLRLKEITVTQARSLIPYVKVENISKILAESTGKSFEERDILVDFLEKVKIQLRKDGIEQESEDFMPFGVLEKVITGVFVKWEREKSVLEGFLNDIFAAFCEEFNLTKESILESKPRNKREIELKVVAEFINMYLERLHQSIESKIRGLERLKDIIINGKKPKQSLSDVLLSLVKMPDGSQKPKKSEPKKEETKKREGSRSRSPKVKTAAARPQSAKDKLEKSNLNSAKGSLAKSNVGRSAKKFTSGLSAIPEEQKRGKVGMSRRNPLDSVTSLNEPLEEGLDDIISDLNSNTKHPKSSSNPKLNLLPNHPRKPEMDSTEGLFNFKLNKVQESKDVFSSIDAPLLNTRGSYHSAEVFDSISALEARRFPKKPPETRSEFITSGIRPFHPYMDPDGSIFSPRERFPNVKADDVDPLDPYYLQNIGSLSPDPSKDWYLRSHHLRSFTNHPFSVNDNPNHYKAQIQSNLKENLGNAEKDLRDSAIEHLEKTLDDLRCEINERRRVAMVSTFDTGNRMSGHLAKAVTPAVQGLNMNEKEGLVMHTYESILDELRARERAILNQKREKAYEIHRPPQGKWYELKSREFTDEMQRHINSLKPKEEHERLLNHLAIPDLY